MNRLRRWRVSDVELKHEPIMGLVTVRCQRDCTLTGGDPAERDLLLLVMAAELLSHRGERPVAEVVLVA